MRIQVSFLGSWQSVGAEYTETRRKHRDEIVDEDGSEIAFLA